MTVISSWWAKSSISVALRTPWYLISIFQSWTKYPKNTSSWVNGRGELPILDGNIMAYPISSHLCRYAHKAVQIVGGRRRNQEMNAYSNIGFISTTDALGAISLLFLYIYSHIKVVNGFQAIFSCCVCAFYFFIVVEKEGEGDCKIRLRIDGITLSLVICKVFLAPFLSLLLSYWFNWKTFCVNFLCHQMTIFHLFVAAYQKSQTLASMNYHS